MREQRQREDDKESELTLSPATLLGIFLGLVLVCGVFFGFGYSVGRRAPSGGSIPSADNEAPETDMPVSAGAKPSAALALKSDDAATSNVSPSSGTLAEPSASSAAPLPVADTPVTAPAATIKPAAAAGLKNPPASDGAPAAGQPVVQVAAVTRAEDADALVSALRQRGYRAMERSEPQDKLLHVQVGPFSSREEANATKQKLLADGYNAIIK